jgi:hypothetical protein
MRAQGAGLRSGTLLLLSAWLAVLGAGLGVRAAAELQAALQAGTCDHLGAVLAPLRPPTLPAGPAVGAPDAVLAAVSFTPAPLPLGQLLATPTALVLTQDERVVACGTIGGVRGADGSLTLVLRPQGGRAVTGIAFLAASGSCSLFVDVGSGAAGTPASGVARLPTVLPTPVG